MKALIVVPILALAGCTGTNTIHTSADTAIITTSAAPICGGTGAARTAQRHAAIETLKAGYDRYIIYDASASSNVRTSQMPGTYHTTGTLNRGFLNATTTYSPGPTIVSGRHKQAFAIKMFKDGQPGFENALSAKQTLGPEWEKAVKSGNLGVCF